MKHMLLNIIGWLSVILGAAGVVLPLLPATPFILLAAWCFARSSPRFHHWLVYRSWFGGMIRQWQQHRCLPVKARNRIIVLTLMTFMVSLWLIELVWLRIVLLVVLSLLLLFLWRLPVSQIRHQ